LIQYGVEEVTQSGLNEIIIITGRGKSSIEDHFDISFELEHLLSSKKKADMLNTIRSISDISDFVYTRQKEALGLGHAVLKAKDLVGDEPFAVVLSDDIIASQVPCVKQLMDVHETYGASVLALMEVPNDQISAYGAVAAEPVRDDKFGGRLFKVHDMVEKPKPSEAPSNYAIIGRYLLTADVFASIEAVPPGSGGEIQLTDGMKHLLKSQPIYGLKFEGKRYDAGDKLGFLKATVEFALQREDLGSSFREYLRSLSI
jgi:UTP--glucose-1-phosphate uridylyltransferase